MSGNGAQGTKFRISVCTNNSLSNNKKYNGNIQPNIEQLGSNHRPIFNNKHNNNKIIKQNIKSKKCNTYGNVVNGGNINLKEVTAYPSNKEHIIKKQRTRSNLVRQLKYIKLMKSSNFKKSYNPRKVNKLIKLCEVMNEDKLQEHEFFTIPAKQMNSSIKRNIYNDIILKDLISNEEVQTDSKLTLGIQGKKYKIDNCSYFSTMKLVA